MPMPRRPSAGASRRSLTRFEEPRDARVAGVSAKSSQRRTDMNTPAGRASRDAQSAGRALATEAGTGQAWWFLGTLAVLRNPSGAPRTPTVIELTIPCGGSPPLHIHENLDDSFLLLDGEILVQCGDRRILAHPGSYVVLPAGIAHT